MTAGPEAAGESIGAAHAVAERMGGTAGQELADTAGRAFTEAFGIGLTAAAVAALAGALLVLLRLPSGSNDAPARVAPRCRKPLPPRSPRRPDRRAAPRRAARDRAGSSRASTATGPFQAPSSSFGGPLRGDRVRPV